MRWEKESFSWDLGHMTKMAWSHDQKTTMPIYGENPLKIFSQELKDRFVKMITLG